MAIAAHPYVSSAPFSIKYCESVPDAVSGAGGAVFWTGSDIPNWFRLAAGRASAAAADDWAGRRGAQRNRKRPERPK